MLATLNTVSVSQAEAYRRYRKSCPSFPLDPLKTWIIGTLNPKGAVLELWQRGLIAQGHLSYY